MKRVRTSYSYTVSPEDEQAKIYIDTLLKKRDLERQLEEVASLTNKAKSDLISLLMRSETKTASAYLIEFTLLDSGELSEKIL